MKNKIQETIKRFNEEKSTNIAMIDYEEGYDNECHAPFDTMLSREELEIGNDGEFYEIGKNSKVYLQADFFLQSPKRRKAFTVGDCNNFEEIISELLEDFYEESTQN